MSLLEAIARKFRAVAWRGAATRAEIPVVGEAGGPVLRSRGLVPSLAALVFGGAGGTWATTPAPSAPAGTLLTTLFPVTGGGSDVEPAAATPTPAFARPRIGCRGYFFGATHGTAGHYLIACGNSTTASTATSGILTNMAMAESGTILRMVVQSAETHPDIAIDVGGVEVFRISRHSVVPAVGDDPRNRCWVVDLGGESLTANDLVEVRCLTRAHGATQVTLLVGGAPGVIFTWGGNINSGLNFFRPLISGQANSVLTGTALTSAADDRHQAVMPCDGGEQTNAFDLTTAQLGWLTSAAGGLGEVQTIRVTWDGGTDDVQIQAGTNGGTEFALARTFSRGDLIDLEYIPTPGDTPPGQSLFFVFIRTVGRDGYVIPMTGNQDADYDNNNLRMCRAGGTAGSTATIDSTPWAPGTRGFREEASVDGGTLCTIVGVNENRADLQAWVQVGAEARLVTILDPANVTAEPGGHHFDMAWPLIQARHILVTPLTDEGRVTAFLYIE